MRQKTEDRRPKTEVSDLHACFERPVQNKVEGSQSVRSRKTSIFGLRTSVILILLLSSCEKPVDWDYQNGSNGNLVVESIITNQVEIQEVKLSQSYDGINSLPEPATGATVFISTAQSNFPFFEAPDSPGTYRLSQPGAAQGNVAYQLNIEWNEKTYTAENAMVQVFPFGNPSFKLAKDSINLVLASTPVIYSTVEQAMYEIDIDWSAISSELPNRAKQIFYTFKTIDVNEIFKPDQTEVAFPVGSKIIVTKYGLNDGFADYLRALVMETEWQGGVFDEASASLPTNISEGGLGYFGVCAVRRDTFIAE